MSNKDVTYVQTPVITPWSVPSLSDLNSRFYLNYENNGESFACAKYNFTLNGVVEDCPEFMPISEGLGQLIAKMKSEGELPEWIGK